MENFKKEEYVLNYEAEWHNYLIIKNVLEKFGFYSTDTDEEISQNLKRIVDKNGNLQYYFIYPKEKAEAEVNNNSEVSNSGLRVDINLHTSGPSGGLRHKYFSIFYIEDGFIVNIDNDFKKQGLLKWDDPVELEKFMNEIKEKFNLEKIKGRS